MAKGDKERKKKWLQKKNILTRRTEGKGKPFARILIVCEGEKTEPNYFQQFKVTSAKIEVVGTGYNTLSLVQEALRLRDTAKEKGSPYDQVWCVFDRDSFPDHQVDNAWNKARQHSIHTAFSNEAFELWFILHFDFINSACSRTEYQRMLSERLGKAYRKNDSSIYRDLRPWQETAIANAEKLLAQYPTRHPSRDNPSTEVHELVQELNKQK